MNRRDALRLLAALVAGGAATLSLAGPSVLAVRAWPGKTSTRITIESDSELRFFVSTLANPDRTVVDISDVLADAAFQKALETLKNDTGVLNRARIGQYRADTARLVLELKSRSETAAFALPPVGQYRHRLVIDLTPANADDPIAEFLVKLAERESTLESVSMNRHKHVRVHAARFFHPIRQRNKHVLVARHEHDHAVVLLKQRLGLASDGQHHVFFERAAWAYGSWVFTAMTRVKHHHPRFDGLGRRRWCFSLRNRRRGGRRSRLALGYFNLRPFKR